MLKNIKEIVNYIIDLDDRIDADFLENLLLEYSGGGEISAELKEVLIEDIKEGPAENHMVDSEKQKRYNSLKTETPPILLDMYFNVIDGHHRLRAEKNKGKKLISCYVLKLND